MGITTMKCAIMQPTYLPWAGYFSMINEVDCFVFFDDVQFARRSWQQRNRINFKNTEKWLTIPVKKTGLRNQLINQVEILDTSWKQGHLEMLKQAYKDSNFFEEVIKLFSEGIIDMQSNKLVDYNINFIETILKYLEIETKLLRSSEISIYGKKSEYLLGICEELGASVYLSAPGSIDYIENEGYFKKSNIELSVFEFKQYPYANSNYIPYLSILDMVANIGIKETSIYLKNSKGAAQ